MVGDGVVQVPEGRKIFPSLSVRENLELGSYSRRARPHRAESLARVFELFPILSERARQAAGTMSGGAAADARHRPGADGEATAA